MYKGYAWSDKYYMMCKLSWINSYGKEKMINNREKNIKQMCGYGQSHDLYVLVCLHIATHEYVMR